MDEDLQLWLQKSGNWVMVGFFATERAAMEKYRGLRDGATTGYKLIQVEVIASSPERVWRDGKLVKLL